MSDAALFLPLDCILVHPSYFLEAHLADMSSIKNSALNE